MCVKRLHSTGSEWSTAAVVFIECTQVQNAALLSAALRAAALHSEWRGAGCGSWSPGAG